MKRTLLIALLSLCLLVVNSRAAFCFQGNAASQTKTLNKQAEKIKRNVTKLAVGHKVTVVLNIGGEYSGTISKIEADGFQINEVDKNREVSIWYNETKKVYDDYYHKDLMVGRNPRKHRAMLVGILSFVAIGLIFGIAHRAE